LKFISRKFNTVASERYTESQLAIVHWSCLIAIIVLYLYRGIGYLDRPTAIDVLNVYLPFANKVLEQGLGFLLQPESIIVSPLSYLWPAILGGELSVIKYVNLSVGVLMVLLTYGIGRQLHSRLVGLIAAFLFAKSPFLISWIPTALSEPPFFLFTLTWIWALGEVLTGRKNFIPIAAIALSLSILTRAVWLYPSIVFLLVILCLSCFKISTRQTMLNLSVALGLGLILPILVILKNLIFFGLPSIDSGSGGALFYGTNLMTNGFEPPLLGLAYEGGATDFHSVIGNREHAAVAIKFLKERSLFELLDWYLTKLSWVTFFTPIEASIKSSLWRVFELSMAITATYWGIKQKKIFVLLLCAGIALQIFQTAFVLYNIRYSTDSLELLLIPLAAVGVYLSLNFGEKVIKDGNQPYFLHILRFPNKFTLISIILMSVLCLTLHFRTLPIITLPPKIPTSILFQSSDFSRVLRTSFLDQDQRLLEHNVILATPNQVLPRGAHNALWEIKMTLSPSSGGVCSNALISFDSEDSPDLKVEIVDFPVYSDGLPHTYLLGTAGKNASLFPLESGRLIMKVNCESDVSVLVDQMSLVVPHFIDYFFK